MGQSLTLAGFFFDERVARQQSLFLADDAVHIATGEIGVPVIQALLDARRLVTAAMRPARKLRQQIIAGGLMLCRPARPGTLELLL